MGGFEHEAERRPEPSDEIDLDAATLAEARCRQGELDSELGWAHMEIARLEAELDEERRRRVAAEEHLDDLLDRLTRRWPDRGSGVTREAGVLPDRPRRAAGPPPASTP